MGEDSDFTGEAPKSWDEEESEAFGEFGEAMVPGREEIEQTFLKLLPAERDESFWGVEIGTGTGWLSAAVLREFPRARMIGLDGSRKGNGSEPNDKIVKWLLNSSSAITAKVKTSSRTARLPTANRSTSAMIAVGKAVKIPAQTPMLPKGARRSCKLTRNVQASGALRAPSGFLVTPLPAGSKKAEGLSSLAQTLAPAAQEEPEGEVLELDELWSFVFEKQRKRWIWIAQCRRTRQVVAYAIGDRGEGPAGSCGSASRKATGEGYSTVTSGKVTKRSCPRINIKRWVRAVDRPAMWRDGTARCAKGWDVLLERRCRFRRARRCTRFV